LCCLAAEWKERYMLKRAVQALVLGYIVFGAATRIIERQGGLTCGCYPDCWCKRPGLSLFRWAVPRWHKGPWNAAEKMERAEA
jgi:hypothetical protein